MLPLGPRLLFMIFVGLELATMIVLIGSNLGLGREFLRIRLKKKKNKILHLLHGITLWTIWIEHNDQVFNHEQWHASKFKHRIWDKLIVYAKVAWERVIKQIKISSYSAKAMLQGFDQTWGPRNVLCRRNNLHIAWNWKWQCR